LRSDKEPIMCLGIWEDIIDRVYAIGKFTLLARTYFLHIHDGEMLTKSSAKYPEMNSVEKSNNSLLPSFILDGKHLITEVQNLDNETRSLNVYDLTSI